MLNEKTFKDEFSHTILHGQDVFMIHKEKKRVEKEEKLKRKEEIKKQEEIE